MFIVNIQYITKIFYAGGESIFYTGESIFCAGGENIFVVLQL
jgi:hypothetical protein